MSRHVDAVVAQHRKCAGGHRIVVAGNGGERTAAAEQFSHRLFAADLVRLAVGDQLFIHGNAVLLQRVEIALQAIGGVGNLVGGADDGDALMPLLDQMTGRQPGAVAIVERHAARFKTRQRAVDQHHAGICCIQPQSSRSLSLLACTTSASQRCRTSCSIA